MLKNLPLLFLLIFGAAFFGFVPEARSGHLMGTEISYSSVAPGIYIVQYKVYRNCDGFTPANTTQLRLNAGSCNTGRSVIANKISNSKILTPYCAASSNICTNTGPVNYEEIYYTATVTFTSAEQACPDWTISASECTRPVSANLAGTAVGCIYVEAYLNLSAGINNNSPIFSSDLVPFVTVNDPITFSAHAVDQDGDSLVYSFEPALNNASTPASYKVGFSATSPVPSSTPVGLNTKNGSITFTPNVVNTGPPANNAYTTVVEVKDYRKVRGVWTKVGTVRRDVTIMIVSTSPANNNPILSLPIVNGVGLLPNEIIELRPGTTMSFQIGALDNNPANTVTVTTDANTILQGAAFVPAGGGLPGGTITWTPNASHVRDQLYYFHVTAMDDACPVKGLQTKTFGVRVSNTGGVTGLAENTQYLPAFTAFPNPFASEITFKVKQTQANQQIVIYNILGQEVDRLSLNGRINAEQEVTWKNASRFPAGQYVARFSGKNSQSLKINKLQ